MIKRSDGEEHDASQIDDDALLALIADCYDAGVGVQPWNQFLSRLGDALDCSGAALLNKSSAGNERRVLWATGTVPERFSDDPDRSSELAASGQAFRRSGIEGRCPPNHDLPSTGLCLPRCLFALAHCKQDEQIILGAWRSGTADPFGDSDYRLLSDLVPHVGRALQTHQILRLSAAEQGMSRSVLDCIPESVFIVGRDGQILLINCAARQMIKRRCGWQIVGERLKPAATRDRDTFRRSLESIFSTDGHLDGAPAVRFVLAGDLAVPPIPVAVTRLDYLAEGDNRERSVAAVISRDPMRQSAMLTPELAETYQLTPSEARLAGMIVNGFSLIDAACSLKVSKNTARSHMKRIYVKTCTENHADLVRTLGRSFLPLFSDDEQSSETDKTAPTSTEL